MNLVRKRKLLILISLMIVLAIVSALVMYALRQNISLFYTPTQLAAGEGKSTPSIRVGGMVVKRSIIRHPNDLTVEFDLTDFKSTITVVYQGILPDLFREGQGVVALGYMVDKHHFKAQEVLAKHDANYMPPEVRSTLSQSHNASVKASS